MSMLTSRTQFGTAASIQGAPASTLLWQSTDTGEWEGAWTGGVNIMGEKFSTNHALMGITPTRIIFSLKKTVNEGTPSGNADMKLIDSSDTVKATFPLQSTGLPLDVSTLTLSFAAYTFENLTNVATISDGDFLGIFYDGAKYVFMEVCATCSESYTNETYYSSISSSWVQRTTVTTMTVWGY